MGPAKLRKFQIQTMKRLMIIALLAALLFAPAARPQTQPGVTRTEDVIYGRKFGMALTLDVFQPDHANGRGILFMVSGGFFSAHENISPAYYQPLLDRGYTVFAVVHGSQPKFTITEIERDIHRAVRFVRHNAANTELLRKILASPAAARAAICP